jgi:predicted regulator of Ras-like GTPase activity (Roadblock/LC7/MglB family)
MEDILKDINAVSGVTGCFVCNSTGQVIASALPNLFDEAILSTVGRTMTQTMSGLAIARRRKIGDIDLVYDQSRLIAKNLREGCLCILCVRSINMPLLNLTANVAAKKLAAGLKGKAVEKPSPRREAKAPAGPPVDTAFLGQLEQELARAIGPMATLVIDEEIEALGESRESFPWAKATYLVEKVSTEIADEGKRLRFTEATLQALREQRKEDKT